MVENTKDLCSVVIPSWNSIKYIRDCLDAVFMQSYDNIEVVIVDNNSTDGTKELIKQKFPQVKLIENSTNKGFAPAMNQGIKASKGIYILALNIDAVLSEYYIKNIINILSSNEKYGSAIGKLISGKIGSKSIIDTTGHLMLANRLAINRGQLDADNGQFNNDSFVFGVCAAASIYKKEMLDDVSIDGEYFDESFETGYEDIDLDWRAQLYGWQSIYVHNAEAFHERNAKIKSVKKYIQINNISNHWLSAVKNETPLNLLINSPFIITSELREILTNWLPAGTLFSAIRRFIGKFPEALRKRRIIQKNKKASYAHLNSLYITNKRLIADTSSFIAQLTALFALAYFISLKNFLIFILILIVYYVLISPAAKLILTIISPNKTEELPLIVSK